MTNNGGFGGATLAAEPPGARFRDRRAIAGSYSVTVTLRLYTVIGHDGEQNDQVVDTSGQGEAFLSLFTTSFCLSVSYFLLRRRAQGKASIPPPLHNRADRRE